MRDCYESMNYADRCEFNEQMATWLNAYTDEVCCHVIKNHIEEIITTPSTRALLRELHERSQTALERFTDSLETMMASEECRNHNPHLDPLSHPDAYREVLYDLYIADMHTKGAKA